MEKHVPNSIDIASATLQTWPQIVEKTVENISSFMHYYDGLGKRNDLNYHNPIYRLSLSLFKFLFFIKIKLPKMFANASTGCEQWIWSILCNECGWTQTIQNGKESHTWTYNLSKQITLNSILEMLD